MTNPATGSATQQPLRLTDIYQGWDRFQRDLIKAIAPLSPEQLALPVSPNHWPIGMLVQHIMNDRVWWFQLWMREGSPEEAAYMNWEDEETIHPAAELVAGLEATWGMIERTMARWTTADLGEIFNPPESLSEAERQIFGQNTRQEIIFHVLRHDMHHGGELAVCMGSHGLPTIWG